MAKRLIYIVDDEPSITEPLAYALTTDGFQVESFTLGQAFLHQFIAKQPALVVLDVGLPDINGFELFRSIKAVADIPVLFLTARGDEIDRVVGLELGADDYVVKPFSPREVAARIRMIMKRCQSTMAEDNSNSTILKVDKESATVNYFGAALELTRFEFQILALLADQPQRVFSRIQLLDTLWPERSGSMERSVDTHIKTLRAKLKQVNNKIDPIKTHRGIGYSLERINA